jgi:hypothetical protein
MIRHPSFGNQTLVKLPVDARAALDPMRQAIANIRPDPAMPPFENARDSAVVARGATT